MFQIAHRYYEWAQYIKFLKVFLSDDVHSCYSMLYYFAKNIREQIFQIVFYETIAIASIHKFPWENKPTDPTPPTV